MDDGALLARQLGREPRGRWRVGLRCSYGYPVLVITSPRLGEDGVFPTLFYLTCPHLVGEVSALESAGAVALWRARLAADDALAGRMLAADEAYRAARAAEGGGADPAGEVGVAGQRDALGTKCLHAHVAAYLGGIADPVGEGVIESITPECADERCARLEAQRLSAPGPQEGRTP